MPPLSAAWFMGVAPEDCEFSDFIRQVKLPSPFLRTTTPMHCESKEMDAGSLADTGSNVAPIGVSGRGGGGGAAGGFGGALGGEGPSGGLGGALGGFVTMHSSQHTS